jgi:adenylate kinase
MKRIIAITGVSGVGKSTFVRSLAMTVPLEHLQASTLIQEGRNAAGEMVIQDQLRLVDLDENQRFLVAGFRLATASKRGFIILDAHTIIEKGNEIIPIDAGIFGAVGISTMIFLEDDPAAIADRRRGDASRVRLVPHVDRLSQIQDVARKQALIICRTLNVALYVYHPSQFAAVGAALISQSADGN